MLKDRAEEIWYKITNYKNFNKLLRKYRKLAGIPAKGIVSEKFTDFMSGLSEEAELGNELPFNNFTSYSREFIGEIKKIFTLSDTLEAELNGYLWYNEFNAKDVNTAMCEIIPTTEYGGVEACFSWLKRMDRLGEGVYIYVSPSSSVTLLKEFIGDNKELIERYLDDGRNKLGLEKIKKQRSFVNRDRDKSVYLLSLKSKQELSDMGGGNSGYKDIQIYYILKNKGIDITEENIRAIISRQRKISEGKY